MTDPVRPDVMTAARAAVAWLDAHNGRDTTQITCRILKIAEELGEATQAWFGATGNNPRKGHTHTSTDVARELADVTITALVALHSLDVDPHHILTTTATTITNRCTTHTENAERWQTCHGCGRPAPLPPDLQYCPDCGPLP